MALRTRILLLVVALVTVALAVLDFVSYDVVSRSLLSKTDAQLQAAVSPYERTFFTGQGGSCYGLSMHSFAELRAQDGQLVGNGFAKCTFGPEKPPAAPLSLLRDAEASPGSYAYDTAHGYRLLAQAFPSGEVLVVGESMFPVWSTLRDVLILEVIVSGSVLVVVGAIAFFLVQLGLLPLEQMARTAGEIAAGDLSRRVEDTDERTEVGRLGSALNVMLSRIEEAFRAKEMSEEQLRQFVADASHELRTPLTSIRGYAELFKNVASPDPHDLAVALGRIESESERMSVLVEDLLLLARLDQGRPLEREAVDMAAVVNDAASDARVIAPEREITVRVSGELLAVGSEGRLRQVLVNLVSNAIAYTPAGSPVELHAARLGEIIRLEVVDHGPGIPEGERSRVFDRFWRADASRQRARGGTGLGLSIVAAVVAAHRGRVFVVETAGGGATFVVELPAAERRAAAPVPPAEAPLPAPVPSPD